MVLPPSLEHACLEDAWSSTRMLKNLAQSSSCCFWAYPSCCGGPVLNYLTALWCLWVPGSYFCTPLFWAVQVRFLEPSQWLLQNQTDAGLRGTEIFTKSPSGKEILNLAEESSLILIFRSSWSDMGSEVLAFFLTLWLLSSSLGN